MKRQWFALLSIALFIAAVAVDLDATQVALNAVKEFLVRDFAIFFTGLATVCLPLVVWLGLDPRANIRLGPPGSRPVFSRLSWFSMLFSAGLASGLVYWATAEPLTHFQQNPHLGNAEPGTAVAAISAITLTVVHWGLHGWAFYVLVGLAIAIAVYRYDQPLALRSALWPLLGARSHGPVGIGIDLIGVLGTVFGVATSIGLAVAGMNVALANLGGFEPSLQQQLVIVAGVGILGLMSVLSGVARGIRRLSVVNFWLSMLLLGAVLIIGPTRFLLQTIGDVAVDYGAKAVPMVLWTATDPGDQQWQGDWTIFYWGWWLAWAPFVGLFIARISAGRSVREFVLGVLLVPTLVVIVWMSVFGGAALYNELPQTPNATTSLLPLVNADYAVGTTALIEQLGVLVLPLTVLLAVLLFSWLITSIDSATLVICHLLGGGGKDLHVSVMSKWLWSCLLALVTGALMLMGGVPALQAASIAVGLPVGLVLIVIVLSLVKVLFSEPRPPG
ncbi:MAG: BCCT family transporter [Pseudomonadales bacterium]